MRDITVATLLRIVLGVFFFSISSSFPMSPEDAAIEERGWRSRDAVGMPGFPSPTPSGYDREEAAYPETNIAESRSILTKLFSPFVGSRTRGNQRGAHKSRENGVLGRRPVQAYQQVRFVSSSSPRFRPKGARGRVPVPSLQPHIFQPITSSPVTISFPAIADNTGGQHIQNTNTLTYGNSPFKNTTNQNNGSNRYQPTNAGNKLKDIPRAREPSPFTVTSFAPFPFSPSTNSIFEPNQFRSSPHYISNSQSSLLPNSHSSLLIHSSNQNRPFLAHAPSIRFSANSQESHEIQDFEKPPPGNSENSVIYKSQSKENPMNGFVSLQSVNDITSNINIDNQFLKSFGNSQISFGPDNSFFLTGNLSEITSHKESKENQREFQSFSASDLSDQISTRPKPIKIPNLDITQPTTSQNTYAVTTTEPAFIFITGAPSPFQIEHLTSLPTTPTGISLIPHQQQEDPQLNLQAFQVPLSHFQTTSAPQQTTPSVQYQPLTTPNPLHELQSTLAPIHQQLLLNLSPKHQQQTTSPKQYHAKAEVTPYWKLSTTQPEYRTQPTGLPSQIQNHHESLLTEQQKGSAPIMNGSHNDNSLQAGHQNQKSNDVNAIEGLSLDNNDGFIPFSNSNDFFNHIFGEENPFGDKITTTVPSNITSASVLPFSSDFNITHENIQQQFLTKSVPFVNRPTQQETILNTASTANVPNTQTFTPAPVSTTSQPLITHSFPTHQSPTTGWPSTPFKSSASVFVASTEKYTESTISQSPSISSGGWDHLEQQDSTTELQTQANDKGNLLNTAVPFRIVEPFTESEGGDNPYTSQLSTNAGLPHAASQTTAKLEAKNDVPSTIQATTTIDNKEFEVLVLPYEKEVSSEEQDEQKDILKPSSIALASDPNSQKSFNPGLPLKSTEEEVSVYLVRHRKPSNISGGSPTPPQPPNGDSASNDSSHLGLEALEFRGFPIPADFPPEDDGSPALISSPSRVSGTAVSASGRHFKFEYDDGDQNGNRNILSKKFEDSFDPQGFDTNGNTLGRITKDATTEISGSGDSQVPFEEPHEYVQVLGLLAPPPGVICDHGICEDEQEFQRNSRMARRGRDKKEVAIFTYSELHSPANDSYFYDQQRPDDRYVCASDVREVRPAWARTEDGSFLKIVNTDAFPQRIRMEVCRSAGEPCSFLPRGVTSSCRQRYSVHKMTAEYPDASLDETFLAAFKVPSGCFCHIRQKNADKIQSDLPGSAKANGNPGSENKISPSLTLQKSLNEQNSPHGPQQLGGPQIPPLLGPLKFDSPLTSQQHHLFPNEQGIQPTLLTSSFQQSTITTTLRPIITMTTSVFRGGAPAEELHTLSPSTTLSPPHFVTHHFHQPGVFQTPDPATFQPELLREVRQNKEKISIYSQQLLDALLYNFNRAESLGGIPVSAEDEDELAFLKELQSLPEGLEITRAGNNTFNLSLRHVVKDGRVKPMNVVVSVENGLVKFIPNPDKGASQYATATITVEELYEVLKKYLEVLQRRKPDDIGPSKKEDTVSDLKASNVPTIHNHGSPIFIFASQTGRRGQTVDVSSPEIIQLPYSLKPDLSDERHKVNLVRKSTNNPLSVFSTSSVNNNKFDTPNKVSKIIDLLRNDKDSGSSINRTPVFPVQTASDIYSSLLQSSLLNEALNQSGLPKESAVLHNLTSIISKQFSSKNLNKSLIFNTIKKAHHLIPVPVLLSASNSTNSTSELNDTKHESVSQKDRDIKNSTHITFHLIPESISNKLNKPKNSLGSKAGQDLHLLLQTFPNTSSNLTNSTTKLQQPKESSEKNGEPSALVPVEVTFHQNFSDYDGDSKQIVRITKQVPPGNGTNGKRYTGALLSTQLFASRPQVIQNYYIRVPESYLRARNGIPLNITARSDEGEMLMEIRTHRTLIPPKIVQKRSEKYNISKEEDNDNLPSSAGKSQKHLSISQIAKTKVHDRQRTSTINGNPGHTANTTTSLRNAVKSQNIIGDNIRPQLPTKTSDSSPINKRNFSKTDFPDWIKGLDGPVPGLRDSDDETVPVGAPYKFTFLKVPSKFKRENTGVF